jgi:bifunctional enzyme CysN/CysC
MRSEFKVRASNIRGHKFAVDRAARTGMKGHKACIVWFTGLSGAGKSTIMNIVEARLAQVGAHTYALDGDNLRFGLNQDLGFSDEDREENVRRAGEVARLMLDAGLIVLCAFISPFRAGRERLRAQVGANEFIEVFVDAPLEVCMKRDPKGIYAKARASQISKVTGIDSPYELPERPDIHLKTAEATPEALAKEVVERLKSLGTIGS